MEIDKSFNPIHGKNKIKEFIQAKNDNRKDIKENNSNDSFYVIETKIDLLDKLELTEDIKQMIEFIDIPGLNTSQNIFKGKEGEALGKIISVSNLFLFINPIDKSIKDNSNKSILNYLFNTIKARVSNDKDFIDSCLFIINKCDIDKNDEIKLEDIKKDISNLLDKEPKQIKAQKFSSLEYINFLNIGEYYNHFELYVEKYKNEFKKTLFKKKKSFELYLYKEVQNKVKKNFKLKNVDILGNDTEISKRKDYLSIKKACNNKITKKTDEIIMMIKNGENNIKQLPQYEKSKINILIPFLKENILNSKNSLFEIISKCFLLINNQLRIFFERTQEQDKKISNINEKRENLNKRLNEMIKQSKFKFTNLLDKTDKEILKLFKEYEKEASQLIKDKKNIEDIINQLNQKIEEKLKAMILEFETENNKILEEIKKIIKELEDQIKESMESKNNEKIELDNIQKLSHKSFDNINKGILFGFSGGVMITAGIISELTASITLGFFSGGIIGVGIGAAIGGIIIGIRSILKYFNKQKDLLELIKNAKIQYISIFDGIRFKVNTKMEEIKKILENLIKNTTNFLNKEISSIQKDKWDNAKKEFYEISNKYETLFGKDLNN